MTAVQEGAVDVIALATGVILAPAEAWTRMLAAMQSNSELREELLRLEQENRVLKGRTQRLASVLAENARYRALLNSARDVEDQLIAAKIIAISPDPARHVVVIDKGSLDGIEQGQAVLGEEGLMGQIVLSGDSSSRAVMITDSAHALPVQVNRSGLRAIAEGSGALDRLLNSAPTGLGRHPSGRFVGYVRIGGTVSEWLSGRTCHAGRESCRRGLCAGDR